MMIYFELVISRKEKNETPFGAKLEELQDSQTEPRVTLCGENKAIYTRLDICAQLKIVYIKIHYYVTYATGTCNNRNRRKLFQNRGRFLSYI